jgi:hypothetical protein
MVLGIVANQSVGRRAAGTEAMGES